MAGLDAVPLGALAGGAATYVGTKVQVGPGCAWATFIAGSAPEDGIEPDEPVASINAIPSRRIILDFPAGKIYEQRLRGSALAAMTFSELIPLHLDGDVPRIGPAAEFPEEDGPRTTKYDNDEFLGFRGLTEQDVVALLKAGEHPAEAQVKMLAAGLRTAGPIRLRHKGKVITIGQ